ncbi:MAG: autotransporter-associated beta strand repeat-containing protein [Kiritimatiellae bacterium]|nr:autotransporter-associated beta strand repeat-containing protein [Kiritimatiellia bacterium]
MSGTGPVTFDCPSEGTTLNGFLFLASSSAGLQVNATRLGMRGTNGAFGDMDISIVNSGVMRYTGPGETTDRTLILTNHYISSTEATKRPCSGVLEQAGTGTFVVQSQVEVPLDDTGTLTLRNNTAHDGVWETPLSGALNLRKDGTGRWKLDGANTYTGSTTVDAGTLYITKNGRLPATSVKVAGGAELVFEGDPEVPVAQSCPTITTTGANAVIRVAEGCTLTLAGVAQTTASTLNIITEGASAEVVVEGQSAGNAPGYLLFNGRPAAFDASGKVKKMLVSVTTTVPVRGGVIPNDGATGVGIINGGESGNVTLAAAATTVKSVLQQADSPATVALAAGEKLTADVLAIDEGKADLTVGTAVGQGTVQGSLTLWPESADSTLTVNSAVNATSLTKLGDGVARILSPFAYTGTLALNYGTIALADCGNLAATLSGTGRLVKEASANWTLSKAQPNFLGEFVLAGGTTRPAAADARTYFGDAQKSTLVVTNGATLYVQPTTPSANVNYGSREVRVSGDGADGNGALVFEGVDTVTSYPFTRLTLDGDTSITNVGVGSKTVAFTSRDGLTTTLNMNGHKLTRHGRGRLALPSVVTNAGPITLTDVAKVTGDNFNFLEINQTVFKGEEQDLAAAPVTMGMGSRVALANLTTPVPVPLVVAGTNAQLTVYNGNNLTDNCECWGGPVTFNEDAELYLYAYGDFTRHMRISGKISGLGGFTFHTGSGHYYFLNPTNDFTGPAKLAFPSGSGSFSSLTLAGDRSLPHYGNVQVRGMGTINMLVNAEHTTWPDAEVGRFMREADFADGNGRYGTLAFDTSRLDAPYTVEMANLGDLSNCVGGLGGRGPHPVIFTGELSMPRGMFKCYDGVLRIAGPGARTIRTIQVSGERTPDTGGTIEIVDGAEVVITDSPQLGGQDASLACLVISNATLRSPNASIAIYAGSSTASRGVIKVMDGADVSVYPILGNGVGCLGGSLWQTGGKQTLANNFTIGNNSTGYFEIDGGETELTGGRTLSFAGAASNTVGILRIKKGAFRMTGASNNLSVGGSNDGLGHIRVSGGEFEMRGTGWTRIGADTAIRSNCVAVVTVDGTGLVTMTNNMDIALGCMAFSTGVCNLNGGVFHAYSVHGSSNASREGKASFVNFNGGTFKCGTYATPLSNLTRLTVREGGAAVDTDGRDVTIGLAFRKPEGGGVLSVPVPDFGADARFIGSPAVVIEGDGRGATAYAEFDPNTLSVTGITVTSPGNGYTWAKAKVHFGGQTITSASYHRFWTVDCVVGAQPASGSFTKKGAGTLTLTGANEWEGNTIVAGGILKIGAASALPADSHVVLAGGGIEVAAGVDMPMAIDVSLSAAQLTDKKARYVLARYPNGLPETLPTFNFTDQIPVGSWGICRDGNELVLRYVRGMNINFR